MKKNMIENEKEDFARMYEESFSSLETFKPGQVVETKIISISKDTIFLHASGKSEGILDRSEVTDAEGELTVQVGDSLKVYFLQAKNGELLFTTKLGKDSADPQMLEQAYLNRIPVEGLVEKEVKGGYEVKIGASRAFCPHSQMGSRRGNSETTWVGTNQTFRVTEFKEGGRKILVSNRVFHDEAQQEKLEDLKKTLQVNTLVKGTVASVQSYGVFVELGGIQALLPASEAGRSRIEDLNQAFKPGQEIEAQVIKLDWANQKISLSLRTLMADPWEQVPSKYPEGSRHTGKVVRLTEYGAFVNLEPGLDGMIHVSELRNSDKYANVKDLKTGQSLSVKISSLDKSGRRISLRLANSEEEETAAARYLSSSDQGETYNPFAALVKKKG